MKSSPPDIYLGTVLLERNRWGKLGKGPTFLVSDWTQRIADEGFDGLELWENHAILATEEEREKLKQGPAPVRMMNSYASCEPEDLPARKKSTELATYFGSNGMKYNFGKDPERHEIYMQVVKQWREDLPEDFRLLCECHRGSTMQDPTQASETLDTLGRENFDLIIHGIDNDEAVVRERFAAYGDRITHIHSNLSGKGLMTQDEVSRRVELLTELGFQGTYTIEFTEGIRSDATIEELYQNAVRDFHLLRTAVNQFV